MLKNNMKKTGKKEGSIKAKQSTSTLRAKNLMAFESLPRTIGNITQQA